MMSQNNDNGGKIRLQQVVKHPWQESIAQGLPIARQDSENISASDNFSDHFQLQIPQLFIAQPPGCRLCHGHDLLPLHLSATCNVYLCS